MPTGKLPNPYRVAAREAGERFYCDALPCQTCDSFERYTVNGACVSCSRQKGSARYAAMTDAERAEQKARDAARYQARLTGTPESA